MRRSANQVIRAQKKQSKAVVDNRWNAASSSAEVAAATAAIVWAPRPPPNSRAISAVSTTDAAPASAGSRRNAQANGPMSPLTTQATAGTKGGWST